MEIPSSTPDSSMIYVAAYYARIIHLFLYKSTNVSISNVTGPLDAGIGRRTDQSIVLNPLKMLLTAL